MLIEKPKKKFVKRYFKSPYNGCSQPYYNHSGSLKTNAGYPLAKHVDIFNVDAASTQIILNFPGGSNLLPKLRLTEPTNFSLYSTLIFRYFTHQLKWNFL